MNRIKKIRHGKKEKRLLKVFVIVAIVCVVFFFAAGRMTIKEMTVTGNEFYTSEEIRDFLFDTSLKRNSVYCYLHYRFGKQESIPFVERYTISFNSPSSVEVIIYEKNIVGYIEYMGSNLYFDRDGMVVESSSQKIEGVPKVTGLNLEHVILYQKLPLNRDDIFDEILNLTQLFEKYDIEVDKIYFDSGYNVQVFFDDIVVRLGANENLEMKIAELSSILPELDSLSGTLYLENYQENAITTTYFFKQTAQNETDNEEDSEEPEQNRGEEPETEQTQEEPETEN